ncbi:hypothetical protein ASPZODRAFT_161363 [Penicilliopsis zonata CBS 506.65]|uniref:Mitochondrial mRNA processing protein PET127 n=1 Tax=Penicilliopsis zonata CBS 506.65 TaxID=1073090 RepID=A0A1L9S9F4_9EURO|nr:hypothetical protein ASPZODRAFT_161363 [Penicilliopsis zonata CBS 506.65]OJJ43790.1 hypothetical protein ASPZODRAFT_161363 [Penicilliopsis zonata CBS 506.65]
MYRTSLRSVSGPRLEDVCVSCLARGFQIRTRQCQLYSTTTPPVAQHKVAAKKDSPTPTGASSKIAPPKKTSPPKKTAPPKKSAPPEETPKETAPPKEPASPKETSPKKTAPPKKTVPSRKTSPSKKNTPVRKSNARNSPRKPDQLVTDIPPKSSPRVRKNLEDGEVAPRNAGTSRKNTQTQRVPRVPIRRVLVAGSAAAAAVAGAKRLPARRKTTNTPASARYAVRRTVSSPYRSTTTYDSSEIKPKSKPQELTELLPLQSGSISAKNLIVTRELYTYHIRSFGSNRAIALEYETGPVPRLSFGLERVLFNPGVYHLRDPRSRVYNFDPYLGSIMPVSEFDFTALKDYITSSKDDTLRSIAVKEGKKFIGSSSSMTSVLSQFHYLLSNWRGINARTLSQGFRDPLRSFTQLLRAPSAMFLHYQDGVYAIDADKEFDNANILMNLGKSMEKLLTLPKEEFERYRRSSKDKISQEEEQAIPEAYHYSTIGDFIMRSQLDAYDPRLPGTGMFDLKTRAVVSIRMDARDFENGLGYEIRHRYGDYESYEREFFDMIRAAFLKYSLQVRVGRMDGIFVAFHNIERIFGFQYISLPEMDHTIHGQVDTSLGDAEFQLSLSLWNKVLNHAIEKFPKQSLRFHFETRDALTTFMNIYIEPVSQEEINAIQTKNKAAIDAYQQRILNLTPREYHGSSATTQPSTEPGCQGEKMENYSPAEDGSPEEADEMQQEGKELLTLVLQIKNKVNGVEVERPMFFTSSDEWTVEYELSEIADKTEEELRLMYRRCRARRAKALKGRGEDEANVATNVYIRNLREITERGREFRKRENKLDKERGIVVLDEPATGST